MYTARYTRTDGRSFACDLPRHAQSARDAADMAVAKLAGRTDITRIVVSFAGGIVYRHTYPASDVVLVVNR